MRPSGLRTTSPAPSSIWPGMVIETASGSRWSRCTVRTGSPAATVSRGPGAVGAAQEAKPAVQSA